MNAGRGRRIAPVEGLTRDQLVVENGVLRGRVEALEKALKHAWLGAVLRSLIRGATCVASLWALAYYLAGKTTHLTAYVDAKVSSSLLKEVFATLGPPWWLLSALLLALLVSGGINVRYRRAVRNQADRLGGSPATRAAYAVTARAERGVSSTRDTNERRNL
ncbi:hypothetical protein KPL74_21530 [Bacillus sp. NP157]|nr:hypothetical protein KPL74_21530 [Bacillus sp. NP157]